MSKIDYPLILKSALVITVKHKFLWPLGFLMLLNSLLVGAAANLKSIPSYWLSRNLEDLGWVILAAVLLAAALVLAGLIARAGAIKAANNIAVYGQVRLINILAEARRYGASLFLLDVLIMVAVSSVAVTLFIPAIYLIALNSMRLALIISAIALTLLTLLLLLVFYLRRYAQIYLVLGNLPIKLALEYAYALLEDNLKKSLAMGVILLSLDFAFLGAVLALYSPLALLYLLGGFQNIFALALGLIFTLVAALVLIALFSAREIFVQSAWVLFFQQISWDKTPAEKKFEKVELPGSIPNPEAV